MPSDKSWVVIFKWQISHYLSYGLEGMGLLKQPPWVLQAEAQSAWRPALGCRQAGEEAERQQTSVLSCIECESCCLGDCWRDCICKCYCSTCSAVLRLKRNTVS
ncbi:unnamed protein product [Pipistrellus nathusii]|uniref:Uncharacterized protein n=1 Tax=Pipistrellus nathusii TaxID=59473 RepID=A0ABN9Z779_PIPNA